MRRSNKLKSFLVTTENLFQSTKSFGSEIPTVKIPSSARSHGSYSGWLIIFFLLICLILPCSISDLFPVYRTLATKNMKTQTKCD